MTNPLHQLADGQVREGRPARRVQHDDHGAHGADGEGYPTRNPDHIGADQERRRKEAHGQRERRAGVHVVVHEHGIGGVHVVVGGISPLHVIVVVVERVHGRLHEHADGQERARHRHGHAPRCRRSGGNGHERRQDGRRPRVRRGQLQRHARGKPAVGRLPPRVFPDAARCRYLAHCLRPFRSYASRRRASQVDGDGLKRLTVSSFNMPPKLPSVFQMKLFVSASSFEPAAQ